MSSFDELVELAKKPAELPEDYADQLSTAYLRDLESRDKKIESLETQNKEYDAKVKDYAVANFDLMRKSPVKKVEPEPDKVEPRKTTAELIAGLRKGK